MDGSSQLQTGAVSSSQSQVNSNFSDSFVLISRNALMSEAVESTTAYSVKLCYVYAAQGCVTMQRLFLVV